MITQDDITKFFKKQEATIWNLSEIIRMITYRSSPYRDTKKEVPLMKTIDALIHQILTTSHYDGPEDEEYPTWDKQEQILKEMFKLLKV